MGEEFLDIVSENNELTGESAPRSKIHAEGIWHRTVHIYLFRKNNGEIEFLAHLRSPLKDASPNKWDTRFGGHIKSGLTPEEGMKDELKEEIGLDVNNNKLIEGAWRKRDKFPDCQFSKVYYLKYDGDSADLKFNDGEVQEVRWMSIRDIKDSMQKNPEGWASRLTSFTEVSDYLVEKLSLIAESF